MVNSPLRWGAAGACAGLLLAAAGPAPAEENRTWYESIDFSGSVRARYEWISNDNPTAPDQRDRNRYRYQALFGFTTNPDPNVEVGIRLGSAGTSAEQGGNVSQNVTYDDAFRDDPLYLDLAYVEWRPDWYLAERVLGLTAAGGKVENPYRTLRLLWDSDITPEGAYLEFAPPALSDWRFSIVEGAWFVEEEDQGAASGFTAGADAYVLGHQIRFGRDDVLGSPVDVDFWGSYYKHVRPSLLTRAGASLGSYGNNVTAGSRLRSEFGIVDVGGRARFDLFGMPSSLSMQWGRNEEARANPANSRVEDDLYTIYWTLGKVKERGDWGLSAMWGRVESDAALAAYVDGDFASGLGSTNFEGFRLGFDYALADHLKFSTTYYDVDEENGLRNDPDQRLLQVDFTAYF